MSEAMTPITPSCAKCGRELGAGERIEHRGAVYCVTCVGNALDAEAARQQAYRRSPALAVLLSCLPGLGQMYNRQMLKGILILAGFLVVATGEAHLSAGLMAAVLVTLIVWNLADAYWTAQRINRAELPRLPEAEPEPFALEQIRWDAVTTPAWGVVLILLGILFLLNNFDVQWLTFDRVWPAVMLCLGLWLLISFAFSRRQPAIPEAVSQETDHEEITQNQPG